MIVSFFRKVPCRANCICDVVAGVSQFGDKRGTIEYGTTTATDVGAAVENDFRRTTRQLCCRWVGAFRGYLRLGRVTLIYCTKIMDVKTAWKMTRLK